MPRGFGRAEDNLQTSPAQLPVGGHAVWHNARRYRRWANVNTSIGSMSSTRCFKHWNDHALD